jgi:cystathionine gamma-synthase
MTTLRPDTLAVHAGNAPDDATGAVAPPLHLSTTFRHGPAGERVAGYEYQREGNPTNDRLREALAALEGGETACTFASGMAAMTTLLECLPNGARVLFPDDCYSGLRMLFQEFLPERGLVAEVIDMGDLDAVRAACATPVSMLWIETPSNPLMKVSDIAALADIGHAAGAVIVVDNTFATPLLQRPLALGADVVMHSTTKYFGGHSDVLGGALVFAHDGELARKVAHRLHVTGAVLAPFSAWLTLRGCRSLGARMAMHCANARKVVDFLAAHTAIERVNWPGLSSHPGHEVANTTDARFRRDAQHRGAWRARGRAGDGRQAARVHQCHVAGRLRIARRTSRIGGRAEPTLAAEPVADFRGAGRCRRPGRGPGAGTGLSADAR